MANVDFDGDDDYINTAGFSPRLPVQATELLGGIGSQILRSLLVAAPGYTPEEYGCSPEEAAIALACCDLAELPAWDEAALLDAATVGGNEEERVMWGLESRERLARRISLAMKAEKAPEVLSAADGVLFLRRAGINVFPQLLDAVAWLQLDSDATLPKYRLLMGITEPQAAQTLPADTKSEAVVEAPESGPLPLTTSDIAHAFDGLRKWNEKAWKDTLGSPPKWLKACIVIPGKRGKNETRWNPVLIGAALVNSGHAKPNSIRAKFQTVHQLKPWLDTWKTYEADNLDTV